MKIFFAYCFCVFLPPFLNIFCFCLVQTISVLYCAHFAGNVLLVSLIFLKRSLSSVQFSSVQSLSHVWLFATPWVAARQASLSITNSQSSLRLTSIESVMPSSHLILSHPLILLPPILPSIRVFSKESTLRMRWPKTGVSALASFLPKKSQGWSPSEWTGWISL